MKKKNKKLTLNRETVRKLSASELARAAGAVDNTPPSRTCFFCTGTCYCTAASCVSICMSCGDTDCCLASVNEICVGG